MKTQIIKGLREEFKNLGHNHTQVAGYYGCPAEVARPLAPLILAGGQPTVDPHDLHMWALLYGGRRSGKTRVAAFRTWVSALYHPGNRIMVVRKRKEQLRNTFLDEFEKVGDFITDGDIKRGGELVQRADGSMEYIIETGGAPSKILFAIEPDGEPTHVIVERFKGYTLGAAVTEETSQLHKETPQTIFFSLSLKHDDRGHRIPLWMLSISNAVERGKWLQQFKQKCELDFLSGQPPAALVIRSKPRDGAHWLPENYDEEMRRAVADDPVKLRMWLEGEDGVEIQGKPVYGAQFSTKLHVDQYLKYNPFRPLIRGWDFGYHRPACVWLQEDDKGCINVLYELLGAEETAAQFADRVLTVTQERFPKPPQIIDYGDPAGAQQTDKGDTTIGILLRKGIRINFRPTQIDPGIKHVRNLLTKMRYGRPELCFHPVCLDLITAFERGYHYQEFSNGQLSDKPRKDGIFDHLCDAIRYALVNFRAMPWQQDSDVPDEFKSKPLVAVGPAPFGAGA